MTKNFATKVENITKDELILASLVERETWTGEEKTLLLEFYLSDWRMIGLSK